MKVKTKAVNARLMSLLLAIFMVLGAFSVLLALRINGAESSTMKKFGDYYYLPLADGTAKIMLYNGTDSVLEIPAEVDGRPVSSITGFRNKTNLVKVTIPEGVITIGDNAFENCENLTEVVVPEGVTEIGLGAFRTCDSLTSVIIPESVTIIGGSAFSWCRNLTQINLPENLISIGIGAFEKTSLTEIAIPDGITSIENNTFSQCSSLTSINIPNSVTWIGSDAFVGCSSLAAITLPDSITSIGDMAFASCSSLTSITIPNSVILIRPLAFGNCTSLTEVTIPNNVTSIDEQAFSGCSSLTSIEIPNSVTTIKRYAFYGCTGLTSITIPKSVTSIGEFSFGYRAENYIDEDGLEDSVTVKLENFTISGYSGTAAETYANENGFDFIAIQDPTQLTSTLKKAYPTSAKVYIERTQGDAKGAISYVLLKGDYSDVDFSTASFEDMKNHKDFVKYEYSNYTKNFNFNITNLDRNTVYTVVPFTVKKKFYHFGLGENITFATTYVSLTTELKTVTADTAKFKISRTGDANGALSYVILKGDISESFKTLEEYKNSENFLANQTSKWTGNVTVTVKNIESGESYTVVPYTQKGNVCYFGLGANLTFTAK